MDIPFHLNPTSEEREEIKTTTASQCCLGILHCPKAKGFTLQLRHTDIYNLLNSQTKPL